MPKFQLLVLFSCFYLPIKPDAQKMKIFEGRTLVIGTKHEKERVIAPIFEKQLGVNAITPNGFDTDIFGTFTGEIERSENPLKTAKKKCLSALEIAGFQLGVSSEGSFGPHPQFFFTPCDEEWLVFIDLQNNLEIVHKEISFHTNYMGKQIITENELLEFARKASFPSHALIVKSGSEIVKGITNWAVLKKTWLNFKNSGNPVLVETDMRAMMNPTRMKVIRQASKNLVRKIKSCCPSCTMPGFSVVDFVKGLPCSACGLPTRSPIAEIYRCNSCNFQNEKKISGGRKTEDPGYCDFCNP
jgi:hypothetical protein